ncbi:MAG: MFS transporter, partial [Elusimicrobiota bacterium]
MTALKGHAKIYGYAVGKPIDYFFYLLANKNFEVSLAVGWAFFAASILGIFSGFFAFAVQVFLIGFIAYGADRTRNHNIRLSYPFPEVPAWMHFLIYTVPAIVFIFILPALLPQVSMGIWVASVWPVINLTRYGISKVSKRFDFTNSAFGRLWTQSTYAIKTAPLRLAATLGFVLPLPSINEAHASRLLKQIARNPHEVVIADYDSTLEDWQIPASAETAAALAAVQASGKQMVINSDRSSPPGKTALDSLSTLTPAQRAGIVVAMKGKLYRFDDTGTPELLEQEKPWDDSDKAKIAKAAEGVKARWKTGKESIEDFSYCLFLEPGISDDGLQKAADLMSASLRRLGFNAHVEGKRAKDPVNPSYLAFSKIDKTTMTKLVMRAVKVTDPSKVLILGDSFYKPSYWGARGGLLIRIAKRLGLPLNGNDTDSSMSKTVPGALSISVGGSADPRLKNAFVWPTMGHHASMQILAAAAKTAPDSALKGKRIVFIGSMPGKESIFKRAKELGVYIILLDNPGSAARDYADTYLSVNLDDHHAAHAALAGYLKNHKIDGIANFLDTQTILHHELALDFDFPAHSLSGVKATKDKSSTREFMMKISSLPKAKFAVVRSLAELETAIKNIGSAVIIKPVSGAGSRATRRISSLQEAPAIYDAVMREILSSPEEMRKKYYPDFDAQGGPLIVEQFLEPSPDDKNNGRGKVIIDTLMQDGKVRFMSVSDIIGISADDPRDYWDTHPSQLSKDKQAALKKLAADAIAAFGLTDGAVHIDAVMTKDGPQIFEINTRMGGAFTYDAVKAAYGVDMNAENLKISVGLPIAEHKDIAVQRTVMAYMWLSDKPGKLTRINGLDLVREFDDVTVEQLKTVGDNIEGIGGGYDTVAWVIVSGKNYSQTKARLQKILETVDIRVESKGQGSRRLAEPAIRSPFITIRPWYMSLPLILGASIFGTDAALASQGSPAFLTHWSAPLLVIAGGWLAYKASQTLIKRVLLSRISAHSRFQVLLGRFGGFFVATAALFAGFKTIGYNITGILTGLGLGLGLIVGPALKTMLENVFSGVRIILKKEGYQLFDTVKIGDREGRIVAIDLQSTYLKNDEKNELHEIPNSVMNNSVVTVTKKADAIETQDGIEALKKNQPNLLARPPSGDSAAAERPAQILKPAGLNLESKVSAQPAGFNFKDIPKASLATRVLGLAKKTYDYLRLKDFEEGPQKSAALKLFWGTGIQKLGVEAVRFFIPAIAFNAFASPFLAAIFIAANSLAQAASSSPAASIISRYPARKILSIGIALQGLALTGMLVAFLLGMANPYIILGLYIVEGLISGVAETAKRHLIPNILGSDPTMLRRFNSRLHIFYQVGGVPGGIIAGTLGALGFFTPLYIVLPVYVIAAYLFWRINISQNEIATAQAQRGPPDAKPASKVTLTERIKNQTNRYIEAIRLLSQERFWLWTMVAATVASMAHRIMEGMFIPQYAKSIVQAPHYAGYLNSASNTGELIGGLILLLGASKFKKLRPLAIGVGLGLIGLWSFFAGLPVLMTFIPIFSALMMLTSLLTASSFQTLNERIRPHVLGLVATVKTGITTGLALGIGLLFEFFPAHEVMPLIMGAFSVIGVIFLFKAKSIDGPAGQMARLGQAGFARPGTLVLAANVSILAVGIFTGHWALAGLATAAVTAGYAAFKIKSLHNPVLRTLKAAGPLSEGKRAMFPIAEFDGKFYLELNAREMTEPFIFTATMEKGLAEGWMQRTVQWPTHIAYFKRVNDAIQLTVKNSKFASANDPRLLETMKNVIPDSVIAHTEIVEEDPRTGRIAICLDDILAKDAFRLNNLISYYYTNEMWSRMLSGYAIDDEQSQVKGADVFNDHIEVKADMTFISENPSGSAVVTDPRNLQLSVNYSFAKLPASEGFTPRPADPRVGYFETAQVDWSLKGPEAPLKRFIRKWRLEKSNPALAASPVKNPVVYWLDTSIPEEYRQTIREAILTWNKAFARVGLLGAIAVKDAPAPRRTANAQVQEIANDDYNPFGLRFNVVQWNMPVDHVAAWGPSRSDPRTGEIINAAVSFAVQMSRINLTMLETTPPTTAKTRIKTSHDTPTAQHCAYGAALAQEAAFGLSLGKAGREFNDAEREDLIKDYIKDVILHEIGHTLGLRHNFKATTWRSLQETQVAQDGLVSASVMDYAPINIAAPGQKQGPYFQTDLGPYDYWAIAYGYTPVDGLDKAAVKAKLKTILDEAGRPGLAYATDEDASRMDPDAQQWKLGNDIVGFAKNSLQNVRRLWTILQGRQQKDGANLLTIRKAFILGLTKYEQAANMAARNIGGIRYNRHGAGGIAAVKVYEPVAGHEQWETLDFLHKEVFSDEPFLMPPWFLSRLAQDRLQDPLGGEKSLMHLPFRKSILNLRKGVLEHIFSASTLERLAESQALSDHETLSFRQLFWNLATGIWAELDDDSL